MNTTTHTPTVASLAIDWRTRGMALEAERDTLKAQNAQLVAALQVAVIVIETWHNFPGNSSADVWPIYYRSAPEMASIRAALAAAGGGK